MSRKRFQQIEELFRQAGAREPAEQAAFLEKACGEDASLLAELKALLAHDRDSQEIFADGGIGDGLREAAEQAFAATTQTQSTGSSEVPLTDSTGRGRSLRENQVRKIKGYEIVRELHSGGQGVVYQALQRTTKRKVAIKVLREGSHAGKAAKLRFEREIALVAQLKHPNIISIFDSGTTADGAQFYVMDYVRGATLKNHVQDGKLALEDTLRLFAQVCIAVQYAHQRGVIHRDLKPSNILVDSEGQAKILDFGLAKQLAGPVETIVSVSQQLIGTLPYMAPEQAAGNPDHIDTRTDIYALGVVLYEILTGHYPYPVVGQMGEVLRHIAETPPAPPSSKWSLDSGVRRKSSGQRQLRKCPIDDEIQTVIFKSLAKERERRYQSAGDLATDLNHYLAGEPIEAKRDSGWYVLKKSVARHKAKLAVSAAFVLLAGAFATYAIADRAKTQRLRSSDALNTEGYRLTHSGWAEAYSKFEQALALNPENAKALGLAAWWKKEEYFLHTPFKDRDPELLRESRDLCNRALQLDPDNHRSWNLKSMILMGLGELQAAEDACRRTLQMEPQFASARRNLAVILAVQHRFDEALDAATLGAQADANQGGSGANSQVIWRTLGTIQLYLGHEDSLATLEEAKKRYHRDTRLHLMLARLRLTLPGHIDVVEALRLARLAIEFTTLDDPRFHRVLAMAYLRNDLFDDALAHVQAAMNGGDEKAYCHLIAAIAEATLGRPAAAGEHLQKALDNRPSEFDARDVVVTAEKGFLWFDTKAEFDALRSEAELLIGAPRPTP